MGFSMAVLLAQRYEVFVLDVVPGKIRMINEGVSPISDVDIEKKLQESDLNLTATLDYEDCTDSEYFVIATPTNYDCDSEAFDTQSIEDALDNIEILSPNATVVIKSTVPVGYSVNLQKERENIDIIYSPEFLREGKSLHDNLYPSRIVVGSSERNKDKAKRFAQILKDCAIKEDVETLITGFSEAESIKLFSNSYLAMRISFFNELDSFSELNNLDTEEIIRGVSLDPRIGDYYNNPSFGYGGYCLPKDAMQLRSCYVDVPNSLISAIVESNQCRKSFIADRIKNILPDKGSVIGAFRLNMKKNSDNSREASILDIMDSLKNEGYSVIVYEPTLGDDFLPEYRNIDDLDTFKNMSDLILANRMSDELDDVVHKVYSRDVYNRD